MVRAGCANPWARSAALALLVCAAVAPATAETTLALDINFGIRAVPNSRVTVPASERVTIVAPDFGPLQWFKNGHPIAGATAKTLVIDSATASDAGTYSAKFTSPDQVGHGTQLLQLGVRPKERLVNLSTRAQIGFGGNTFVGGFSVSGDTDKKIVIRAIGPSLAMFGVGNPVQHPKIEVFDSQGHPYTNAYVYAQCTTCLSYEQDLAESLAKCGAFPIPDGTADVVQLRPFAPGSYTVHVTSADNAPGVVLLEIYEVP